MIAKALRYEWAKWRARRESLITVIFLLAGTIAYGSLLRLLAESDLSPAAVANFTGVEGSGFHLAFQTTRAMLRLLGLFLLLWSATTLAGELERGTLRAPLLRLPRSSLVLGKTLVLGLIAAILALGILGLALALGAWSYGLEAVQVGSIVLHGAGGLLAAGVAATLLSLLPLLAILALGICLSCLLRSAQAALSLALTAAVALWALSLLPGAGRFFFPATLAWPFQVALSRSEGLKTLAFADELWLHCCVNVVWILLLLGLSLARFQRRDLTA